MLLKKLATAWKCNNFMVVDSYLGINFAKFAQVPSGYFNNNVVKAWLKAGCCGVGD